ncbi:hypothetical protein HNQ59_001243 [Chitinivorax tropicus]|uniref:Uncharacterized protein n=1 Tax=Chitinivorax tropicus TaxID=714531 RepID=A0A840MH33_9PROT|nr:hypothetical protein [Chitinivorax tropicus]MBB5017958.1 hypothetical protein [Chitinivorax tropicus]
MGRNTLALSWRIALPHHHILGRIGRHLTPIPLPLNPLVSRNSLNFAYP